MIELRKKMHFYYIIKKFTFLSFPRIFVTWLKLHCDLDEKAVAHKKHEVKRFIFFSFIK